MDLIVKGWDEETKTMLPEVGLSSPRKCWPEWFGNKIEVIGDIYQNPELLKAGDEP